MITIKIQCGCGQKFAFDVEPVNGRMPAAVQCPVCGRDGTAAANQIIAQQMPVQAPVAAPPSRPTLPAAPPEYLEAMAAAAIPPPRKAKWLIPALALVVVLICGAAGFFFWQSKREGDVAPGTYPELTGLPQTGEELNRWYVEPPAGQNAAELIRKGIEEMQVTQKDRQLPLFGNTKLPPANKALPAQVKNDVFGFLDRNRQAIDSFARATQEQARYPVDLSQGLTTALPHLSKIKEATQTAALMAMSGADRKDEGTATLGISIALRLTRSLEQEPLLISQLVRIACVKFSSDALEQTFNRVALFPGTLEELQATLAKMEAHESSGESITRAFVGDRVSVLSVVETPQKLLEAVGTLDGISDPKMKETYESALKNIKPKKERQFLEETYNQILVMRKERLPARLKVEDYIMQRRTDATNQNVILFPMFSFPKQVTREASALGYLRLGLTAVALERFRSAHGNNYPESLAELAPEFLAEIPSDPFDGQPLRFKRDGTGYLLYSIGQDLQDDGGRDEEKGKGDLAFSVINPPKANHATFQPKTNTQSAVDEQQRTQQHLEGFKEDVSLPPEIVSFITSKEQQANDIAQKNGLEVDGDLKKFFAAARAGRARDAEGLLLACNKSEYSGDASPILKSPVKQVMVDVALAYQIFGQINPELVRGLGKELMDSLPPGCIYFGGTDFGRGLPTALCKAPGDPIFVLSQNPLFEKRYVQYVRDMYGTRIRLPETNDVEKHSDNYLADAQRRQKLNQLKPGETVRIVDGKPKIEGQVSAMAVNALIAKAIFEKNPDREFYIEESFPLEWMYPHLSPHGLVMKINRNPLETISREDMEKDREFWSKQMANKFGNSWTEDASVSDVCEFIEKIFGNKDYSNFKGDREFIDDPNVQKILSKLRSSIGGIYSWRLGYSGLECPPAYKVTPAKGTEYQRMVKETDFVFKQAFTLCPSSPEAVYRYVQFLSNQGRNDDAILVAQTSLKIEPKNDQIKSLIQQLEGIKKPTSTPQIGHLKEVDKLLEAKQNREALKILDEMLANPDTDASVVLQIAQRLVRLADTARLEKALERMTELLPDNPEAWYDLAGLEALCGKKSEALKSLEKAIALSNERLKDNSSARNLLAEAQKDSRFNALRKTPEFQKMIR